MFASIGMAFQPAIVALDRITDLMSLAGEEKKENGIRICGINNRIEFNNVSFSYDTKRVLSSVSFIINKGEKIVFAGPNGSGKSTIVKLMLGLYRAQSGSILFDSQDIEGISLSSLRERISIVSQNTFLFNDSIRNNILYSRPEATEKEIEEAIRLSGACDFIKNLERGLDTGVGERGVRISGGERQKISIARAILKNSDVVVFDEATAHLDKESEQKLANLIREKFSDKTCIIISHGISDLAAINKIYFLREGHIIKETWLEVTS
jgi:ABC-type multidrug transport system fused ATPase/permease subunit